jgi:glutamate-ammonia-ligase adenylyltransferase
MAGDALVGETFERLVQPLVYRRFVLDTTIDDVRRNKRRMEKQSQVAGEWETNLKNGYGGIRDIEFTAQLMQLAHGGRLPRVRTGNTLQALDNLRDAGFLPADDAALLAQAYCFLRTVEHRIQILNELQTHHLPTDEAEMNRLARRLGFEGRDPFVAHLNAERGKVREVFERLFYGEHFKKQSDGGGWRDLLQAIEVSKAKSQWIKKLQASGFEEPEKALQLLRLPLVGSQHGQASPETRRAFLQIAPDLLSLAVRSPSPDAFIGAIDSLAATAPNASQLYVSFHDSPEVMRRLGELAVYAPPLMEQVVRHQELLDLLFSDEIIEQGAKPRELMAEQLVQRLKPAKSHEARLKVIEAFSRRETVRIGARDVWGEAEPVDTAADLYNLSACLVEAIFNTAAQQSELADAAEEMALIGMGKLGGKELNYSSDWDLIFVHSGDSKKANRLVEVFLALCAELKTSGVPSNIDPRLRPEGRFGSLTRPIASFKEYYETQAEVWEKQALIKTSFVAGNQILGKEMLGLVNEVTYAHSLTKEETAEIRHMKSRLENERLNPDERETDIKLGRGGLTDIEFTVQLLQMRCGFEKPDVRQPNTLQALHALLTSAHIERPDFLVLYNAYRYLYSLRNRMYLLSGLPTDLLPTEGRRLTILARGLGTHDTNRFLHNHHTRLDEVSQVVKRLFWG